MHDTSRIVCLSDINHKRTLHVCLSLSTWAYIGACPEMHYRRQGKQFLFAFVAFYCLVLALANTRQWISINDTLLQAVIQQHSL